MVHDDGSERVESGGLSRRTFLAASTASALTLAQSISSAEAQSGSAGEFWPDGARLVISVSMMVEAGSEPTPMVSDKPGGERFLDTMELTDEQYGWREAIPRMLDAFDRRKIKVSSFISGKSAELNPELIRSIGERGHEIAAHGREHENQFHLSRENELSFIKDGADSLIRITGKKPVGYNAKTMRRSKNTLSILQELGFTYHVDDLSRDEPFLVPVNGRPFVVVPYTRHCNDVTHFIHTQQGTDAFEHILKAEFEQLYLEAEGRRRLMRISLHDLVAKAARVRVVEQFIAWSQQHKGVVYLRKDDIAKFALTSPLTIKEAMAT